MSGYVVVRETSDAAVQVVDGQPLVTVVETGRQGPPPTTAQIVAAAGPVIDDAIVDAADERERRLRGLRAALAASATTPVDIVCIGDSVTQGWAGPTAPLVLGTSDWVTVFERVVAARAGASATPGRGWLPPRSDVLLGTYPYGWGNVDRTIGGTTATDGSNDLTSGLGQWARTLAVGDDLTHTDTCDGVTIYWTAQRTGGASVEVRIDGSLVHTITTTDGTIPADQATDSGRSWTSDALTAGSHTVLLTATGSGTAKVDAGYFHLGNRTSGVRVHKGGHSGWYSGSDWSGSIEHVANVQPACVIVYLGLNDYVFQSTAADYQADYEALIDDLAAAAPDATIIAVVPGDNYERSWDAWHTAGLAAVAATDAILVDLQAVMGDISDTADPYGLSNDGLHLSEVGMGMLATVLADIVIPGPLEGAFAAGGGGVTDHGDLDGLADDDHTQYALADGTRGSFLRTALGTGTTGTVTHADGGVFRFASALTTPGFGLRATGGAADRMSLGISGILWGDGTNPVDAGVIRTAAGVLGLLGKLRPGTPSNVLDAADAAYVQSYAQPLDSDLTAIAALSTTAFGRALLALADAAALRTAAGLGTLATASTVTSSDITDGTIVNADINASAAIAGTKVDAATDTTRGTVELGTDAETQTGTDTTRAPSLASAAATFLRKLLPTGTTGTITHADGGIFRFVSAFTTPGFGLRNTGDTEDRAALGINSLVWGTGSATPATGITGNATTGVVSPVGSTKIRPGTPSNALDAADKAYVDGYAQPLDTELTAIAGLTSAADKGIQFAGAGTAATFDLTAAGKALLDDADAAAQRTTLGLGTAATTAATDYATANDPLGWGRPMSMDPLIATTVTAVGVANRAWYCRSATGGGAITKVGVEIGTSAGNVAVATYASTNGEPASRTETSGSVACPAAGWAEVALGGAVAVSPGDWFCFVGDGTTASALAAPTLTYSTRLQYRLRHESSAFPPPATATPATAANSQRPYLMIGVA